MDPFLDQFSFSCDGEDCRPGHIHTVGMKTNTTFLAERADLPAAVCPQQCSAVRLRWPARFEILRYACFMES
ncbi:hypothetical protein ABIC60_004585 [Phyllobacterium ifriqiyense]